MDFDDSDLENCFEAETVYEKKLRKQREEDIDSEVEVFNVASEDESDDDDQSDIALSDVEGQDQDDDLPDVRAWGKEKKKYYGADYVDQDYGGFQGKDAHAAEIEEEEAKNLQSQLMQQLDDNDFSLDIVLSKKPEKEAKEQIEELIKTDLSKLTKSQKLAILKKESPEFFSLVQDFLNKIQVAQEFLQPIIQRVESGAIIGDCKAVKFVQTHYQLILNYLTNIYMYLLIKANNKLKNHPIIQRLYQYRQLLSQVEPVFDEVIKPQIELLLAEIAEKEGDKSKFNISSNKKRTTLNLLKKLQNGEGKKKAKPKSESSQPKKKIKLDDDNVVEKSSKKVTFKSDSSDNSEESDIDMVENNIEANGEDTVQETEEVTKRAITYQIAKNKGLTPHRKKELRNPRVKHKLKFRKALIRRKGAVREPRKELNRYSGEISGIKATVSKSIKIKS